MLGIDVYKKQLKTFDKLITKAVQVSEKSGGIDTTAAGIEATKIYTRLTLSAITICSILPHSNIGDYDLWDYPSVAILTRAFIETTHRYLYLSELDIPDDEKEFRILLHFYRMNFEKYRLGKDGSRDKDYLEEFEKKLPQSKEKLIKNPIFETLSDYMQKKIKDGYADMHFSDECISKRFELSIMEYKAYYRILSNHSHGAPMSTTTQSNTRGRGEENDSETELLAFAIFVLNRHLSRSIMAQVDLLDLKHSCVGAKKFAARVFENPEL